jgi:hypothetical protein
MFGEVELATCICIEYYIEDNFESNFAEMRTQTPVKNEILHKTSTKHPGHKILLGKNIRDT